MQDKLINRGHRIRKNQNLVPIYYRLQNDLKKNIENGKWVPGKAIPPAQKIAANYSISLGTAHKAILNLVNEGYLYRIQGVGTFVAGTTIRRESLRYIRMRKDFLTEDFTYHIRLLDLEIANGNPLINAYLKISDNEDLFRLKRIFYVSLGDWEKNPRLQAKTLVAREGRYIGNPPTEVEGFSFYPRELPPSEDGGIQGRPR
jgi:DNA-binding transcriptional regulator YhcF (GntR family)